MYIFKYRGKIKFLYQNLNTNREDKCREYSFYSVISSLIPCEVFVITTLQGEEPKFKVIELNQSSLQESKKPGILYHWYLTHK